MAKKKKSKLDEVFKNKAQAKKPSMLKQKAPKPQTNRSGYRPDGCPFIVVKANSNFKDYAAIKRLVDEYKKHHPKQYNSREFIIYILTGLVKSPKGLPEKELAHAKKVLAEARAKK